MQDTVNIMLEEYIPLKIILCKDEEAVEYISYSKKTTSTLEVAIGVNSKQIKRITLLLCKEFSEIVGELVVKNYEEETVTLNDSIVECDVFKAILYSNGVKLMLSKETSFKYIKMGKIYLGLSDENNITEICIYDMSVSELNHLRTELELQ